MKPTIIHGALAALSAGLLLSVPVEAKPGKGNSEEKGGPRAEQKGGKPKGKSPQGKPSKGKDLKPGKAPQVKDRGPEGRKGPANKAASKKGRDFDLSDRRWRFDDGQRRVIRDYFGEYRDQEGGLPPGIAKRLRDGKRLPKGWRDKLAPGYVLDSTWRSAFVPVSYSLFPRIPVVDDTQLYLYGDRLVRVYEPSYQVVEVVTIPTVVINL